MIAMEKIFLVREENNIKIEFYSILKASDFTGAFTFYLLWSINL